MYLRTLEIRVLKYMTLILQNSFQLPDQHDKSALKITKIKLNLLTDIDMLALVEKGIRGGICHSINLLKLITGP